MSEISEYNVKISVINIIKSLIVKVDVIQDKMVTFCIEMKYIKQKKLSICYLNVMHHIYIHMR